MLLGCIGEDGPLNAENSKQVIEVDLDLAMKQVPEIYARFKEEERFISLLKRYEKFEEIGFLLKL